MNGFALEPLNIKRSVRQSCPLSTQLYVLSFEPLPRKLEEMNGDPHFRGYKKSVTAYADDVTVIVSREHDLQIAGEAIKDYEAVERARITLVKSVDLQFSIW